MKLIERIEISYFRSFAETAKAEDCSDLNIFSGNNDTGKSNILRALNLFFTENKVDFYNPLNFENDFSKQRKKVAGKIKAKRIFQIRILFKKLKFSGQSLPDSFWIEKTWDKEGTVSRKTRNTKGENLKTSQHEASTTKFLKKIYFFYVPAIKSKIYFDFLKDEYQKSLANAIESLSTVDKSEKRSFEKWSKILTTGDIRYLLNEKLNSEALRMLANFKQSTPEINDSFVSIPRLDFSKALQFQTDDDIPLSNRGDGVQAKFIPHILNEISKNNKSPLVIWGFEEPENSYEYSNAQKLADEFLKEHCTANQIFLTTHSFNFLTINDDKKVSKYRVSKNNGSSNVELLSNDADVLYNEIGVVNLLKDLWEKGTQESKSLKELMEKSQENNKITLLVEGKNDIEFLEKLLDKYLPKWKEKYELESFLEGVQSLKKILLHLPKIKNTTKYIGIFDNDTAGSDAYEELSKKIKSYSNIKIMTLPELDWAKEWPVRISKSNDKETLKFDLNGKALPIEMYFWKLFEKDFSDDERIFEYKHDIFLPDSIKMKLQTKIRKLEGDEENIDGEKIIDHIKLESNF